jgi:hypothetical protein
MAEQPCGVGGVLVAVAGGKLKNGKIHILGARRGALGAGRLDSGLKPKASSPKPRKFIPFPVCNPR